MAASKKDVVILVLIAAIAGIFLSGTFTFTKDDIDKAKLAYKKKGLIAVMPFLDDGYQELKYKYKEQTINIYTVSKNGSYKGAALELITKEGYSGTIKFLLGLNENQKITGLYILDHSETPGLGSKAANKEWWGQFLEKSKPAFTFKVKKDGGMVDAITASTITSRAITNAVDKGMDIYSDFMKNGKISNVTELDNGQK